VATLIDSTVFIEAERQQLPVASVLDRFEPDEELGIAAVTVAELLLGIHLSAPSPARDFRRDFIEDVIASVTVLDFDLEVARQYAEVWAGLRLAGYLIAPHDLMIGSTALVHGFAVLTHNVRDFARVPGLTVRQPNW
jgi:predicted nucleic acid-binding protein